MTYNQRRRAICVVEAVVRIKGCSRSLKRRLVVAVCIIMEFAGMNAERYEALMNQLRLRGVNPAFPNGVVSNVVGFTGGSALVVNVWDSKQLFEDFLVNRLTPALGAVGGLPQPRVTTFEVYKSYTASPSGEG
jgi:hypothetical protein